MKPGPIGPILFRSLLVAGCLTGIILTVGRSGNILQSFSYYTLQSNAVCLLLFAGLAGRDIYRTRSRRLLRTAESDPASDTERSSGKQRSGSTERSDGKQRSGSTERSSGKQRSGSTERSGGKQRSGSRLHVFKGGCTLYILITFLVYHFLLNPRLGTIAPGYQAFSLSDTLVHYFTPLLVLLDYLLFDPKGRFRVQHPLYWALLPLSYPIHVIAYVSLGGRFGSAARPSQAPYFFLDIDRLGAGGVAQWILVIAALFMVLAYALVLLDRWLGRRSGHSSDGPGRQPPAH